MFAFTLTSPSKPGENNLNSGNGGKRARPGSTDGGTSGGQGGGGSSNGPKGGGTGK